MHQFVPKYDFFASQTYSTVAGRTDVYQHLFLNPARLDRYKSVTYRSVGQGSVMQIHANANAIHMLKISSFFKSRLSLFGTFCRIQTCLRNKAINTKKCKQNLNF
jgi:hypothetical protein